MPPPPDDAAVRYVSAWVAAVTLERAASWAEGLEQMAHSWFPDHDAIDRRAIVRQLAAGLEDHRRLVLQRLDKLMSDGRAVSPGGAVDGPAGSAVLAR